MPRYSLTSLLALIALASLGCAALLNASPVVAQVVVSLLFALNVSAIICATFLTCASRAFAGGAAIATVSYAAAAFAFAQELRPLLVTDRAGYILYEAVHSPLKVRYRESFEENIVTSSFDDTWMSRAPEIDLWIQASTGRFEDQISPSYPFEQHARAFSDICHALWALVLGWFGGILAVFCYNRGVRVRVQAQDPKS